jgi:hypothetical protein
MPRAEAIKKIDAQNTMARRYKEISHHLRTFIARAWICISALSVEWLVHDDTCLLPRHRELMQTSTPHDQEQSVALSLRLRWQLSMLFEVAPGMCGPRGRLLQS